MFFDKTLAHKINRVQEGHYFVFLLEQTKSVTILVRNVQLLMNETYKTKSDLNAPFMKDLLRERNISYKRRHGNDAQLPKVWTTCFGIETRAYLGNKLAAYTYRNKESSTLPFFVKRMRCWNGDKCNCRLCKAYTSNLIHFIICSIL